MSNSNYDSPKKHIKNIKYGKLSRTLNLMGLVIGSSQKALAYKIKSQLKYANPENIALELLKKQIELITNRLSHLKGGLMKVGQMLSVYGEYFLPPDINEILKNLQSKSAPFEWETLRKILIQELGDDILEKLQVDPHPLASASIGQVHLAKCLQTSELYALKIQYPQIEKAIESDLVALKSIFKIADLFPKISHLDLLFQEVESMLKQELDYVNEMNWTQKYYSLLKEDSRYIVPKVHTELTSTKVITTSFEPGEAVDSPNIKSLPQEIRNQLAQNALDIYFMELFKWGFVQTDPHIGNYKIRLNADAPPQIILYDFGAVREYTPEFLNNYKGLVKAAYSNDLKNLEYFSKALNFVKDEDPQSLKDLFYEFCFLMIEPFTKQGSPWHNEKGEYDWSKTDLPKRLTLMVSEVIKNYHLRSPPREVVFLDRKTTGVFIFLAILGAKIDSSSLFEKYLGADDI